MIFAIKFRTWLLLTKHKFITDLHSYLSLKFTWQPLGFLAIHWFSNDLFINFWWYLNDKAIVFCDLLAISQWIFCQLLGYFLMIIYDYSLTFWWLTVVSQLLLRNYSLISITFHWLITDNSRILAWLFSNDFRHQISDMIITD